MSLDQMGELCGTDKSSKGSKAHGYLPLYEPHMEPLRDERIVLFEIGVGAGSSLKMWEMYFKQGMIHGMDNNRKAEQMAAKRIKIHLGDQGNGIHVDRVRQEVGCRADFIIDDGSHVFRDQRVAFSNLFRAMLKPGGLYIIEDIDFSYGRFIDSLVVDLYKDTLAIDHFMARKDVCLVWKKK